MAIKEGPRLINKSAMKLNRLPREWIKNHEWVSLMDNDINVVPDYPNCQKLSTLLLQRNPLTEEIPDSFFLQMPCLKVLELSNTGIRSLPESVSTLCNLCALLLRFSKLKELPSLAMLKEVRVLDLSHSLLRKLPLDIDNLINLRRLDLSYTEKLKAFPSGVIQKLSYLENFSTFKSNWRWSSINLREGVFNDISSVPTLTSLGLSFEDRTSFIDYVRSKHWKALQSYHLGIGLVSIFQGCNLVFQDTVIELPDNIQQLALHSCHEFIIMADNCFPSLELLVLRKLPKLRAIFNGIAASQVFRKLKNLQIHSCNSMKYLFSSVMLQDFQNLEEIEVWNSSSIEDETRSNISVFSTVLLPKLRRLYFSRLPELKYITTRVLIVDHLETIEIWDCEKLRALPFSISYLPSSLKNINGNRSW